MVTICPVSDAVSELKKTGTGIVVLVRDSNKRNTKAYHELESFIVSDPKNRIQFMQLECDDIWLESHQAYDYKFPTFLDMRYVLRRLSQLKGVNILFTDLSGCARAPAMALLYGASTGSLDSIIMQIKQMDAPIHPNPWMLRLGAQIMRTPQLYGYLLNQFPPLDSNVRDPIDNVFFDRQYFPA